MGKGPGNFVFQLNKKGKKKGAFLWSDLDQDQCDLGSLILIQNHPVGTHPKGKQNLRVACLKVKLEFKFFQALIFLHVVDVT